VSRSSRFFHKTFFRNQYKETFGVDISKDVFDVHGSKTGHNQYRNDESGFRKYLKELPKASLAVMEAR